MKTIKYKKFIILISFILLAISWTKFSVLAVEEKLSLTITPPLFQVAISPGENWNSNLKIVNVNDYDLTVYASVMNFSAEGEEGRSRFIPLVNENQAEMAESAANWIEITKDPIVIPREKSFEVPFTLKVPSSATPGGHYAAILIGTQPVSRIEQGALISVSSFVTSLFFISVSGQVQELGDIREFYAEKTFYQKPKVNFTLRFENSGNVHLQPQGDIAIYNIWGEEKGKIPINQNSNFGNVMPSSMRKFNFDWEEENNLLAFGRYQAIATLTFGKEEKRNVFSKTYFWVIPIKQTLVFGGGFLIITFLIILLVRLYVRKLLRLNELKLESETGRDFRVEPKLKSEVKVLNKIQTDKKYKNLLKKANVVNLRKSKKTK